MRLLFSSQYLYLFPAGDAQRCAKGRREQRQQYCRFLNGSTILSVSN
jgi:hypothetical protein